MKYSWGWELLLVFLCGALGYGALELLWRGYTHISMLAAGGMSFMLIYLVCVLNPDMPLVWYCFWGMLIITGIELAAGLIVNVWLDLAVWDYSGLKGNLWGQVCPVYSGLWFLLCVPIYYVSVLLHRIL